MRAVCCLMTTLQLLGTSLAATIPPSPLLTLYNNADVNLSLSSNSNLLLDPNVPSDLSVPPPAAPYHQVQGRAFLKFYDYGAALPPGPVSYLLHTALTDIIDGYGVDSSREIGQEIVYSQELDAGAGTLWFSVEPEANMTWGMFAAAAVGAVKFVRRWDNVEFAVDVEMRINAWGKVGTAYLSRF